MAEKRSFSTGQVAGIAVAALAVGFYLGSVFMQLKNPAAGPGESPAAHAQQQAAKAPVDPKLAEALSQAEAAVAQKPGDQALWIELGNLAFDAHQPARAVTAYEKAVALGPVSADVWTDLGIMHREQGDAKKAIECFDAAMKLDPRHENAHYNKGVVLLHDLGDAKGAAAAWGALLKLNPMAKNPEGRPLRDMVEQLGKN